MKSDNFFYLWTLLLYNTQYDVNDTSKLLPIYYSFLETRIKYNISEFMGFN